jgi:glutamine synthetase
LAEYLYLTETGELCSKTVVLDIQHKPTDPAALPPCEALCEAGDVVLQPRSIYPDPLRGGNHVLVLCDVAPLPASLLVRNSGGVVCCRAAASFCFPVQQTHI